LIMPIKTAEANHWVKKKKSEISGTQEGEKGTQGGMWIPTGLWSG